MTERRNIVLARRACIARNQARLEAEQALLKKRRASHGRTVSLMHRLERLATRQLYLETGGDPFDRRWSV